MTNFRKLRNQSDEIRWCPFPRSDTLRTTVSDALQHCYGYNSAWLEIMIPPSRLLCCFSRAMIPCNHFSYKTSYFRLIRYDCDSLQGSGWIWTSWNALPSVLGARCATTNHVLRCVASFRSTNQPDLIQSLYNLRWLWCWALRKCDVVSFRRIRCDYANFSVHQHVFQSVPMKCCFDVR